MNDSSIYCAVKTDGQSLTSHIEALPPTAAVRIGKRRLTLSRRPRKPASHLLHALLRRFWRALSGSMLRLSLAAAAVCAAWDTAALAAAPPVNALPVGGVITSGVATIGQAGNTMTINQSSNQAIGYFASFNIGANAAVIVNEPGAASSFLAHVTGTDPSQIYGLLKSNGTVMLVNQSGILVGPGGKVDVAHFVASGINISDSDFQAGRLNFANSAGAGGTVENQGLIKTGSGGSVYLIGGNVSNSGIIHSPNGEVILAAGESVELLDTGTPGVSVKLTGAAGNATNLGKIIAQAGTIGIAAGLIDNSGRLSASSVVHDGGRIFLRASDSLTTAATSSITADSAGHGGNVVLYSAGSAFIDGKVSATGAPGAGGYVETSGLTALDVVKAPILGAGGTWYIDPYDLTVVGDSTGDNNAAIAGSGPFAITSTGNGSTIKASSINTWLSSDMSVTLATTGSASDGGGGNITINAAVVKSAGANAKLTLDADGDIIVNANITSTSGTLDLDLFSNFRAGDNAVHSVVLNGATIALNGGTANISDGIAGFRNGNLSIVNGGVFDLGYNTSDPNVSAGGSLYVGNLAVDLTSSMVATRGEGANVIVSNLLTNDGTLTLGNTNNVNLGTLANNGNATLINVTLFTGAGASNSGNMTLANTLLNISAAMDNSGTLNLIKSTVMTQSGVTNEAAGTVNANYLSTFSIGQVFNNGTMTLDSTANKPIGYTGDTTITVGGGLTNNGNLTVRGLVNVSGGDLNNSGNLTMSAADLSVTSNLYNNAGGTLSGTGTITPASGGYLYNDGVIAPGSDGTVGSLVLNGNFQQYGDGTLLIDIAGDGGTDQLLVDPNSFIYLDGTLKTRFLDANAPPASEQTFQPFGASTNVSGVFRHVLGDVANVGGSVHMLKASTSDSGIILTMSGSEDIAFSGGSDGSWGNISNWSTSYFPTAIDNVTISGGSIEHTSSDGTDAINTLTVAANGGLSQYGGTIIANNLTSGGEVAVNAGTLQIGNLTSTGTFSVGQLEGEGTATLVLSGNATLNSLSLERAGAVTGSSGSLLNVNGDFEQFAGSGINSGGNVIINQTSGDLTVGNITAASLVLASSAGAITQSDALHITRQLIT